MRREKPSQECQIFDICKRPQPAKFLQYMITAMNPSWNAPLQVQQMRLSHSDDNPRIR